VFANLTRQIPAGCGAYLQPTVSLHGVSSNSMTVSNRCFEISLLPERFAITRLAPTAPVPPWAAQGPFFSITRTAEELSIVTAVRNAPEGVQKEADFRALKVHGPFALSEIGVLSALAAPLADAKISLFVISTFDTDYLLVSCENLQAAVATLKKAGHQVQGTELDS
jgi:hypothetical protein